jgi:hypothetical protein
MNLNKSQIRTNLRSLLLLLTAGLAFFLAACDMGNNNDNSDNGGDGKKITIEKTENGVYTLEFTLKDGEDIYLSLSTGEEITGDDRFTQAWDVAFHGTRTIWTNSGDSAKTLSSGGQGAVWHTDKTVFEDVVLTDAVKDDPFYTVYNEDIFRWTSNMEGITRRRINVMTYIGYQDEDKPASNGMTEGTYFKIYYTYNKKAFYSNTFQDDGSMTMPPNFYTTNQVYIIKHGTGTEYSKLQITEFKRKSVLVDGIAEDTYKVIWKMFD